MDHPSGYWSGSWPGEDAGPARCQAPWGPEPRVQGTARVTSRDAIVATMVIGRAPGEIYLLGITPGAEPTSWVELIDPVTLETKTRSEDLAGGPAWPGGLAAHANGSLYVVFGRHAHRLSPGLDVLATAQLPRERPYNSFVILDDGCLVTKDFGGATPTGPAPTDGTEIVVLEPNGLSIVARCELPEPSVARLSASGNDVYVVGLDALWQLRWDEESRTLAPDRPPVGYRREGEGFGWDCVVADGSAWFLNNGEGSERYAGTLAGLGVSRVPQAIVRVALDDGSVSRYEIDERPGGIVANPPAVDASRGVVVGYDSGHGVVVAWSYRDDPPRVLWRRELGHGSHPMLLPDQGLVVLGDFDLARGSEDLVVLDVTSGAEVARTPTGSPVQSVLFGAVAESALYYCSFFTVARVSFGP